MTTKQQISKRDFYFETPPYTAIEQSQLQEDIFTGDVDAYSSKNNSETTYKISREEIDTWYAGKSESGKNEYSGFHMFTLTCKRKGNDILRFVVYVGGDLIFKIGQYPSLANIQFAEIGKKYDKILPQTDLKNLKKAVGLAAHGTGAGSFVYLRKIFENLINENFRANKAPLNISTADFKKLRMLEKITKLKQSLPSQLIEMKSIYKILGKGVHELTEEECLRYFRPIKLSIELILDQKIEEKQKQDKDKQVKDELQLIHQEISKKV